MGDVQEFFAVPIPRRPRTSVCKKRKRVENNNVFRAVTDHAPNVVIIWKNWWAYEGEEEKDMVKLIDRRKERRSCKNRKESAENFRCVRSSGVSDEGLNILHDVFNHSYQKEAAEAFNDLNLQKRQKLSCEQSSKHHDMDELMSLVAEDEPLSLPNFNGETGLECLRSAYTGKSEDSIEESYGSDKCNRSLFKEHVKNAQQLTDENTSLAAIITCQEDPVFSGSLVIRACVSCQIPEASSYSHSQSGHVLCSSKGDVRKASSPCHFPVPVAAVRKDTCPISLGFQRKGLEDAQNSFLESKVEQEILMECPFCKKALHGDINNADDNRVVNQHIDACLLAFS